MVTKSFEFKQALNRFGVDVRRISGNLYQALSGEVPPNEIDAAVAAGRQKLADYESLLAKLDDAKKAEAIEEFGDVVERIRGHLAKLDEAPKR
jgi:hypothetical protein